MLKRSILPVTKSLMRVGPCQKIEGLRLGQASSLDQPARANHENRSGLPFEHQLGTFLVVSRAAVVLDPTIARTVRFPASLRDRLAADANRCGRSFEGQVIALLRRHYGGDVDIAPTAADILALASASLEGVPPADLRKPRLSSVNLRLVDWKETPSDQARTQRPTRRLTCSTTNSNSSRSSGKSRRCSPGPAARASAKPLRARRTGSERGWPLGTRPKSPWSIDSP